MVLYFFWKISKCTIKFENQSGQAVYIRTERSLKLLPYSNNNNVSQNSLKKNGL